MSAMPQEAHLILEDIKDKESVQIGCHNFVKGTFEGTPVVFTYAGVGKVSAATSASLLIAKFGVDEIVFTGVAGGGSAVEIGDVVIGNAYLQHDMDTRPFFPQFHIYSLNQQVLKADRVAVAIMKIAAERFLQEKTSFPELGIHAPKAHEGVIVSGDQFIQSLSHHQAIVDNTKEVLPEGFHAIEMEGAAVAQVCNELQVPFVVLRAISDKANHQAFTNCQTFIEKIASQYSYGILKEYMHEKQNYASAQNPHHR
jgi:adenosylhomocysteine nucleosidase